jgi:glyoxylase-like metal-dependent hydrolase (beta-lactamase superfamily II)
LPWDHIPYVNAYLIALEEGVMLVDCGTAGDPSATETLESAIEQAGWRPEDVKVLVGTHTHSDHVGTAEWIVQRSGAAFWMHPASAHFYDATRRPQEIYAARERRAREEGVPEAQLDVFADVREETEGVMTARDGDHELTAGVRLPSRLGDWEVVETPGHSPSHVGLVQRERRILIAGDLVSFTFSPYFDYGYSDDPVTEFLASLDTVQAIGPFDLVLPGHGRPLDDIDALVALHREGTADRLARTRAAVAEGPAGAYEITLRVFGRDIDGEQAVWRLAESLTYLRHLRLTGEVVRERIGDGTFRHRLGSA